MPNWCHNTLSVRGEPDLVRTFVEANKPSEELIAADFKRLLEDDSPWNREKPTWEQYLEQVRKESKPLTFGMAAPTDYGDDWYDRHLAIWGTKWDANFDLPFAALQWDDAANPDETVGAHGLTEASAVGVAVYKFATAWSPPVPWAVTASEQHPDVELVLRFAEVGNDYAGEVKVVAGVIVEESELAVAEVLAPEEMWF